MEKQEIEIGDNAFWVLIVAAICTTITCIVIATSHYYSERMRVAMENGYEEGVVAGSGITQWLKADEPIQ
jgi:hypothetical protein